MNAKCTVWFIFLLILVPMCQAADHAVILQYHNFSDETPPITSVGLDAFIQHLDLLESTGFTVWPLPAIIDSLNAGAQLPDRCAAITVDDAYENFLTGALPILEARNLPSTLFVPTGAVDDNYRGYLDWDQLRLLKERGVTIASHGHDHLHMADRLDGEDEATWRQRIRRDIELSRERLTTELGVETVLFAYPYGEYNLQVKEIVGDLGLTAFGQQSGPLGRDSDFLALPRFPASGIYANPVTLHDKIHSLPLPVLEVLPREPVTDLDHPVLRVQLQPGDYRLSTLAAFVSGQGAVPINWVDRENLIFEIAAESPLANGRNRYNITMATRQSGRYMWFSSPWLKR
jgi:peptidoglycan/xylan/chitin deacetylase (PgdA/CDA1 family)